jgi:hypothetical protein
VSTLFAREWRLLRDVGALTSPAPAGPVVALAPYLHAFPASAAKPAPPAFTAPDAGARVLLAHRFAKGDAEAVGAEVAWLAAVFERSAVRVTARPASLAKESADYAAEHRGVKAERIVVVPAPLGEASVALVEVLAAP